MEIENIDQGTSLWHQFRSKGIGSSDAPAIMGASPWRTPRELYYEKITPVASGNSDRVANYAQQRGIDMEPKARAAYELINDMDMPPTLFVHPEYEWMRASLDGFNSEHKVILEIKCPGKPDHALAKKGQVPEKYVWQLEHQLLVTGAKRVDYFSYFEDAKTKKADHCLVTYFSDEARREKLLAAEFEFWERVKTRNPPPLTTKDALTLGGRDDVKLYSEMAQAKIVYDQLAERAERAKEKLDLLKEKAIKSMSHDRVRCEGLELVKQVRLGSVDYTKIPQLQSVDLEAYRKADVVSYVLRNIKEDEHD